MEKELGVLAVVDSQLDTSQQYAQVAKEGQEHVLEIVWPAGGEN